MSLQDPQAEPSMEEILASIRRIISEEEQTPEEPLELTQAADDAVAGAPAAGAADDDLVFEALEEAPAAAPAEPAPAAQAPSVSSSAMIADMIVSPPAASAAAGALSRLAGTLRISDVPNQTIEGLVRELLKPMLKDWLDENLPKIVEAQVEAELERIARLVR